MPKELKLWQVRDGKPQACSSENIDLEIQLEDWLEQDISLLDQNLLVIGRQVSTDLGLQLDLLCMDQNGDLVVLELKKGKAHREVVAQILDYGAWAQQVSSKEIDQIANEYLKKRGPLEEAFRRKFDHDLPENIGTEHRLIIVAPEIEPKAERVISYLSEQYGVSINAATFGYYRTQDGAQLLGRVFLLEPEAVEQASSSRNRSKKYPNLTFDQLRERARKSDTEELYDVLFDALGTIFTPTTTRSSVSFKGTYNTTQLASIVCLYPGDPKGKVGLYYQVYLDRICQNIGILPEQIKAALPRGYKPWKYSSNAGENMSGFQGTFQSMEEVNQFLSLILHKGETGSDSHDRDGGDNG